MAHEDGMNIPSWDEGVGMTSMRTRRRMIERLQQYGINHKEVLSTMESLPRHCFVEEALQSRAYEDTALPIGYGQTISRPYTVARMTSLLLEESLNPPRRVLEIGTGSGYQTAVLSMLVEQVCTIERIRPLADKAKILLCDMRFENIQFRVDDGAVGWSDGGQFDAILMTAAASYPVDVLIAQLRPEGFLLGPFGSESSQQLMLIRRSATGLHKQFIEPARFVALKQGLVES